MKILIADDDHHIVHYLGEALRSYGNEVLNASSKTNAQAIIERENLDCAIIDARLDVTSTSGVEVFRFAREKDPATRLIMLSAWAFEDLEEQVRSATYPHDATLDKLLDSIKIDYVYKGGDDNYIDVILRKLKFGEPPAPWYGKHHALLISVQDYNDAHIANLAFPASDAEKLNEILVRDYVFESNRVYILRDPRRREILSKLLALGQVLGPDDSLLIFYAGHGLWSETRQQGYWLPVDAERDSPANWISNGDIRDFIAGINTRNTLLVADACFSGAILKSRDVLASTSRKQLSRMVERKFQIRSRKAITSGDDTQRVPDRSIFITSLLDCLSHNRLEALCAEVLFADIVKSLEQQRFSDQNPVYGAIQHAGDEVGGDFVLVRRH